MSVKINGKEIAKKILLDLQMKISNSNFKPTLAVVDATDDMASRIYLGLKQRAAEKVGINFQIYKFNQGITASEIKDSIRDLNSNKNVDAILLQVPLNKNIVQFTDEIVACILPEKDCDGLTALQFGSYSKVLKNSIPPATVEAILHVIGITLGKEVFWEDVIYNRNILELVGMNILAINNSDLIGKPIAMILSELGATVTIANESTTNLKDLTKNADIIISATGKPELISSKDVKDGVVAIDITSIKVGESIKGDFIFDEDMIKKCKFYTPVPGGIGPMTVAFLMRRVVELAKLK
jgi:methylenetetrahydrofolate dehydrogenase (NADP+)/methenyltetrahydrofolate cyclohydrolase